MNEEVYYKIKKKGEGEPLYSTGGSYPKWSVTGKSWKNLGFLKNHLNLVIEEARRSRPFWTNGWEGCRCAAGYEDAEIAIFTAKQTGVTPVKDLISEVEERQRKKEVERQEREARSRERAEKAELARLKAKYDEVP